MSDQSLQKKYNHILFFNIIYSFLIKGGSVVISLLSFPMYMKYFENSNVLGLWFTMLSVLSWLLTFDLGLGNGLRNRLVFSLAENKVEKSKTYISTSYFLISIIGIGLLTICIVFASFVNWNDFFNVSEEMVSQTTLLIVVNIILISIFIQLILKIINSILYAIQKSSINNLITLISSIIIFVYLFYSIESGNKNNILELAIVYAIAVNLPLLVTTSVVFGMTDFKKKRPSISYVNFKVAKDVLGIGLAFFWVQIVFMLLTTTNEFLISKLSSPEDVVDFQVYFRFFSLFGILFTLALTPLWSLITQAIAEKNDQWVKKVYKKISVLAFFTFLVQLLSILFIQKIIDLWLRNESILIDPFYALVFTGLSSLLIWNAVISTISNGLGMVKSQSYLLTIGLLIKIPASFYCVMWLNSWIGVIVASCIGLLPYCVIQPLFIKKMINNF
ncbi:MAG: hypothetical protein C0425_10880 [Chlorobiaceae bacterium]|nr:hypothetical protein [Chlorobiaceae bacterium]